MEWLAAIERLAPVEALKASFVVYPLVNAVHILAIGVLATSAIAIDLRILGGLASLDRDAFIRLGRRCALAAFALAVATGLMLFSVRASEYAVNPALLAKLALIGLAGLNLAVHMRFSGAGSGTGIVAKAAAALSIPIWLGAIVAGRFIGFV